MIRSWGTIIGSSTRTTWSRVLGILQRRRLLLGEEEGKSIDGQIEKNKTPDLSTRSTETPSLSEPQSF
jgi:hypothetical protein